MAYAAIDHGEIVLQVNWIENEIAGQVPGMNHDSKTKLWRGPLSWGTYVVLKSIFPDITVSQELSDWLHSYISYEYSHGMALRDATEFSVDDLSTPEYDRLYRHQQVASRFLHVNGGLLVADEMGVGKTPESLVSLELLGQQALPALIVCPNSVKGHWSNEAAKWAPSTTPYIVTGSAKDRRTTIAEGSEDPSALFIINFESVRLHSRLAAYGNIRFIRCHQCGGSPPPFDISPTKCESHPRELNHLPIRTVIVDEAHRMKDPKAKQTRAIWAIQHGKTVTRRWALTGTPIASNVGDLWSIMHGIAPEDYPTRTKFIDRYALIAYNHKAILDIVGVRPDTQPEFDSILQPRMRRMLKSRVARHLPPKVYEVRETPMTTKQAKAYAMMAEEMIAEVDNGDAIVATTNLTKAIRLIQFSSAYAQLEKPDPDDHSTWKVLLSEPSPKLDVMEEVLEELGNKQVAICAASRQLIEMAAKRLDKADPPISYRMLTGLVPPVERQENIDAFQRGDIRVMLFTIAAGGVGVNMSAADTIIFLQRSWSMLENRQAEDRVHRMGSEIHESVTIVDLVTPETIEISQLKRLSIKAKQLEEIVRDRDQLQRSGLPTDELDRREIAILSSDLLG